jgi:hypothetical protein
MELVCFEGFFQTFSIAGKFFLELSKIPKIINLWQIRLGTKAIYNGFVWIHAAQCTHYNFKIY